VNVVNILNIEAEDWTRPDTLTAVKQVPLRNIAGSSVSQRFDGPDLMQHELAQFLTGPREAKLQNELTKYQKKGTCFFRGCKPSRF
jgi:hypothetical protein